MAPQASPTPVRFTVLTCTYNRARLLPRVYQSLCAQTFRGFEWLVIDDGSSDGTRELVAAWSPFFSIRYHWKENGGMHTAVNLGVEMAGGEFVVQLDSDNACLPHALERLAAAWLQIPEPEKYAALVGLCVNERGEIIGSRYPGGDYADAFNLGQSMRLVDKTERWGLVRTDVWRKFPSPEYPGEKMCDPGIWQNRMLQKYAVRYFNEPLMMYHQTPGSMSRSGDFRWSNPRSAALLNRELMLARTVPLWIRLKAALNAARFAPMAALVTFRRGNYRPVVSGNSAVS